jgi:hypothetical protein
MSKYVVGLGFLIVWTGMLALGSIYEIQQNWANPNEAFQIYLWRLMASVGPVLLVVGIAQLLKYLRSHNAS